MNLKRGQKIEAVQYFVLFLTTARPNDPRIASVESQLEKLKGDGTIKTAFGGNSSLTSE
jgi:hypothetical protein